MNLAKNKKPSKTVIKKIQNFSKINKKGMVTLKKICSILILISILMSSSANYNCYGVNKKNGKNMSISYNKKYKKRKVKNRQKKEINSFVKYLVAKDDKAKRGKNKEN